MSKFGRDIVGIWLGFDSVRLLRCVSPEDNFNIYSFREVANHNFVLSDISKRKKQTMINDFILDRKVLMSACSDIIHISVFGTWETPIITFTTKGERSWI